VRGNCSADLVKHCFHLFFLCRVITEFMRVRESCTSPLVQAEARLCSTSNSVAQKEEQYFSYRALLAWVYHGRISTLAKSLLNPCHMSCGMLGIRDEQFAGRHVPQKGGRDRCS